MAAARGGKAESGVETAGAKVFIYFDDGRIAGLPDGRSARLFLQDAPMLPARLHLPVEMLPQPDETTFSRGLAYGYGLGMRFPLLGREAFVESRRHRTTHVYSSKFVPLSFGIRF